MEGRILKPMVPDLKFKMDALVHDLTQALEETSCSSSVRIKVGFRRRARSSGELARWSSSIRKSIDSMRFKLLLITLSYVFICRIT